VTFADAEARAAASAMARLANATAAVVLPAECAGVDPLSGIFDAAYLLVDVATGVESAGPVFTVADEDLPEALADAFESGAQVVLEIRECEYSVIERRPDATGLTVLRLRK
jgi:hypothetical protein